MASFSKFGNDLYTGERSYNIVGRRRIWFSIAGVLVLIAILVPCARLLALRREAIGVANHGPFLASPDIAPRRLCLPVGQPALRGITPIDHRRP